MSDDTIATLFGGAPRDGIRTREELRSELLGLADSLDDHVSAADAARALRALIDKLPGGGFDDELELSPAELAEARERADPDVDPVDR
jgi:hypothetical protein